ncbi:hypothetical protein C8R46DRAFT_1277063 [Mycena filopes]|nr:hypothetical protein C8R46DRAFT_1277063 [Mycena filopes]
MSHLLEKLSLKNLRKRRQSHSTSSVNLPAAPPMPEPVAGNGNTMVHDPLSKDLQPAWASATTDPVASKADKALQKLEDSVASATAIESNAVDILTTIETNVSNVGGVEAVEKRLASFAEGVPVLLKALDEVAKLHPFIGVVVITFKAIWALEQKRRDNDGRIQILHSEMTDTMAVLIQYVEEIAPDGSTIRGRIQELARLTADDIKSCGNCCDAWSKKRTLVKVIKGPFWEERLVKFVGIFTRRRSDFLFALSIHTALGVDAANRTLSTVDQTTQEMNEKMEIMLKMFRQFMTPEQKEMDVLVRQRGVQTVLRDDKVLKELNDIENRGAVTGSRTVKPSDIMDLKNELRTDPDSAMEQNMVVFSRKFEVQSRQLVDEMRRVVEHQGDRIIDAVTGGKYHFLLGPHERIIDPNVHAVWKDMYWRASVKARHFVMGLRDHFQESHIQKGVDGRPTEAAIVDKSDEWALEYINVARLQPISEAWDDDASGFVTVAEVNRFTSTRPLDWSLPRWIAYWAIGHHQAMQHYVTKIHNLFDKMFAILPKIAPVNQDSANGYLALVSPQVYTLTGSLIPCPPNDALQAIRFNIDDLGTLELVTGEGRIDRYALIVIYLLLEQHFRIFRICQTRTVHIDELGDAQDTMEWVFLAIKTRLELLQSIFKQQKFDVKQQLRHSHSDWEYDDSLEPENIDISILNHPVDQDLLDFDAYKAVLPDDTPTPIVLKAVEGMLGLWHGFYFSPATSLGPASGMFSMNLRPSSTVDDVQHFTATVQANVAAFQVVGECRADEPGTVAFTFARSFPAEQDIQYYVGAWVEARDILVGTLGFDPDAATHDAVFVFKRLAPEIMCFTPTLVELAVNKPRALWAFAIGAVRFNIRRSRWTWSFFKERRDNRERFISLFLQHVVLPDEDVTEQLSRVNKKLTTADYRFYSSLALKQLRAQTDHVSTCDNCNSLILGSLTRCLVCQRKNLFNTVDFCTRPECITTQIVLDDMEKAHQPHHDLLKVRRMVHQRQLGKTNQDAKEALKRARALFKEYAETGQGTPVESDGGVPLSVKRLSHILSQGLPSVAPTADIQVAGPPSCGACGKPVSQPCWYCVQCQEGTFICWECDAKPFIEFGNHDFRTHDLVRVLELEKELTMEERFAELETRSSKHEQNMEERLGRMDDRLTKHENLMNERIGKLDDRLTKHENLMNERIGKLEATVEKRMAKMEDLLERILTKL